MLQGDFFEAFLAQLVRQQQSALDLDTGLISHLVQSMLSPAALAPKSARKLLGSCLSMLGQSMGPEAEHASAEELQRLAIQV